MALTLAASSPKAALVLGDRSVSYRELLGRAWRLAETLRELPTKQVLIFSENSLEWAIAAYSVWAAKKVLVPLDCQAAREEFAYVLDDSEAQVVFHSEETRELVEGVVGRLPNEEKPRLFPLSALLAEPIEEGQDVPPIVGEDDNELATIIYTSGTTGEPKGVMLTFGNLLANLDAVRKFGYFPEDERVLLLLPLHHVLPLMGCLLAPLATGGTSYLCPSLARDDIIAALAKHEITMLVGVPRFFELLSAALFSRIDGSFITRSLYNLAERLQSEAFSRKVFGKVHRGFGGNLRYMICGGAPLDPHIVRRFRVLGIRLCEGYGMTECAPLISFPDPKELEPGYCGKPLSGSDVEIRGGEIVVRGPQVMRGYYNRPDETDAILSEGWLHTGDLGEFNDRGQLRITGRKKEILILPNGKNVNPALSELLLEKHDEVAEVGVFLDGEVLHALVVVEKSKVPPGEKDLESFIFSQAVKDHNARVAPYRKISRVTVIDEPLPRTRLSKLKRHKLSELARVEKSAEHRPEPKTNIERELIGFLARLGCGQATVQSRLGADLGLDSMGRLELKQFVASAFGARVEESELGDRLRVVELSKLVEERQSKEAGGGEVDWGAILEEGPQASLPSTSPLHVMILVSLRILVGLFLRLKVRGSRELPPGPKIFAPNHTSALDGVFLTCALRLWPSRDVYFLAKEKHMKHPVVRFLADRSRIIVLDESAGLQSSLKAVAAALQAGRSVVVFPEGTRSKTGELGAFQESYAIVAHHTGVPIVPVAIQGALQVLPPGKLWPRVGKRVHLTFLPEIEAKEDKETTNAAVRAAIAQKLG